MGLEQVAADIRKGAETLNTKVDTHTVRAYVNAMNFASFTQTIVENLKESSQRLGTQGVMWIRDVSAESGAATESISEARDYYAAAGDQMQDSSPIAELISSCDSQYTGPC